jgi:hypothetical protein
MGNCGAAMPMGSGERHVAPNLPGGVAMIVDGGSDC